MEFTRGNHPADLLVQTYWKGDKKKLSSSLSNDFTGGVGEIVFLYPEKGPEKRIALLGLGPEKEITVEKLRRAFGSLIKEAAKRKLSTLNIEVPEPEGLDDESRLAGVLEGILFSNYSYSKYKSEPFTPVKKVGLLGLSKAAFAKVAYYQTLFEGVNFARDLVNGDPDEVIPAFIAEAAQKLGPAKILDKKALQKEKMGLILAVAKGSKHEPYLIALDYKGNPKSKERTVLIGKGVTYDTGGLNIKTAGMETMKADMGGAAAVLGAFLVAKKLKLKINLSVVVPTAENAIGSLSYKPGSVHVSHSGRTVEIGNTDAEGRLLLADAISWTKKHLHPTRIIDLATLTGAMRVALGPDGMGLFSNNDVLADSLMAAGAVTYERAFRFPLIEEYRENLNSGIADISNIGGAGGGSIVAALFLKEFVEAVPWAHLDIASCAFYPEGRRYYPRYATGIGVRLLIEYLRHL